MDRKSVLTCKGAAFGLTISTALLCPSSTAFAQTSDSEAQSLHIGILAPFSGPFEQLGRQVERGVMQAIDVYGPTAELSITVTTADDGCDEAGGRDAANRLIGAQVDVVIGGVCWRPALAARDVLNLQDVPFYASGVRHGGLTDDELQGVLRINGRDDDQARYLANALLDGSLDELIGGSLRRRALVILYTDGSYGRTLAEGVRDIAGPAGLNVAMYEAFEPDEGIVQAAERAQAEDPGLVMVLAGQADSALMVSALRDELGDTPILAGDSVLTPEFPLLAGEGAEGVVFARPTAWRGEVRADDLAQLEGDTPGTLLGLVAPSIAATQVALAQAAGQGDGPYETVLGSLSFEENGDADLPSFQLWQWRSGTVWPLDAPIIAPVTETDPS